MINIDILNDETLQEIVNKMLSGLLPHEKFSRPLFIELLRTVDRIMHTEEFSGEYYVLFKSLAELAKITVTNEHYEPRLTEHVLDNILGANITDLIKRPEVNINHILSEAGQQTNLSIATVQEVACQLLYERCMNLFKKCIALGIDSSEALSLKPALKGAFLGHVAQNSIREQVTILNDKLRVGKNLYSGGEGWVEFSKRLHIDIERRLSEEDTATFRLDSADKGIELLNKLREAHKPLANFGMPPMDSMTPMECSRLVVIVGPTNTGKTKVAVDLTGTLLKAGHRVCYMFGEATKEEMYSAVLSNYIYKTRNIYITMDHIKHMDTLPEDKQRLINIASIELAEKQLIDFRKAFNYRTVYEELVEEYEKTKFSTVVIDHSLTLIGTLGSSKENIDALSTALREFKVNYPVQVIVTSQPSPACNEAIEKGKPLPTIVTKESGTLTQDADHIFVLKRDPKSDKRGLISIENTKRRGAPIIENDIIMRMKYNVSALEWDDTIQNGVDELTVQAENGLQQLKDHYSTDDDSDDIDDEYMDIDTPDEDGWQ